MSNSFGPNTIRCHDLSKEWERHPKLAVIDVRTPVEFEEVHVPQARLFPLDQLQPEALAREEGISKSEPLYVLCRTGGRAAQAAKQLSQAGFQHAIVVEGGTMAWIEAGLPVIRGKRKVIALERQVRIAAGALVLTGVILGFLLNPAFFFLSGFVGAGLVFAGVTDWCGMGLLLAKAPWNR
jgi:rhodanese-related sulfurtransferase